jgi:hypothetical protein
MIKLITVRFLPLAVLSFLASLSVYLTFYVQQGENFNALLWNLSHLHMNYVDFGFVKRGLLGTLFRPVLALMADGSMAEVATILVFDIAVCLGLIASLAFVLKPRAANLGQSLWFLMLILLIAPTGFMQFGFDITRYDHFGMVLVIAALFLVAKHRMITAGLVLGLAVLNHEAVVIWGVPVVLAYGYQHLNAGKPRIMKVVALASPAVLAAIGVLLFGGAEIDPATVLSDKVSLATSVWSRGLVEPALFFRKYQYLVIGFYAIMPFVMLHWYYKANGLSRDLLFFAPFACLALFVLGVDYSRWTTLILFACACVIVVQFRAGHRNSALFVPLHRKVAFGAYVLPLGPIGITAPLPYLFGLIGL